VKKLDEIHRMLCSRKGRKDVTQRTAKTWRALRILCGLCVKKLNNEGDAKEIEDR
jgi:hypothetical protein